MTPKRASQAASSVVKAERSSVPKRDRSSSQEGSEVSFCGAMGARERARRARREREARQRRKEKERFHPSLCKDKKVGSLPSFFRIPFPLLT
jgi:hypothetical protein